MLKYFSLLLFSLSNFVHCTGFVWEIAVLIKKRLALLHIFISNCFSNCGAGAGLVKLAREGREMKSFRWIGQNTKQTPSVGRSFFLRGNRFLDLFQVLLVSSPTYDSLGFWQKLDYGNWGGSRQSKPFLWFLFTRIGGLESILCLLLNNLTMVWKQCCESDRGEWVSGVGSPIRGTGTPLLVYTVHWVVCTVFLLVYTVHWVAYTLHWVVCTAPNYLYLSLCLCLLPMPLFV